MSCKFSSHFLRIQEIRFFKQTNDRNIEWNSIYSILKKKNDVVKNGRNCAIEFIYGKTFFLLYSIFNAFLSERCIRFMIRMKITRFNIRTIYLFNKFYGKLLLLCIKLVKNDIFLIWNTHKRIDKLINVATSKPSILFH